MKKVLAGCFALSTLALMGCSNEASRTKSEYIHNCLKSGVMESVCTCSYNKLKGKHSLKELRQLSHPTRDFPEDQLQQLEGETINDMLICGKAQR